MDHDSDRVPASTLLRDRSVLAVLLASFASSSATVVQVVALGKLVYDMTGRQLDLGLLGLAEFLPTAALVLVTGSVADRFDRRKIGAAALIVESFCAVALAAYASTSPTAIWPIFAIVLIFGSARGFAAPALRALAPSVAPPGMLSRMVAFSSISWQAASIVGPIMAGFLYAVRPMVAFVAAAAFLLAGALGMAFVRLPASSRSATQAARAEPPSIRTALEGLHLVRRSPVLLAAISLDLFAVLFGGAVALLPAIAKDRLGVGAVGLGWLRAAGGLGAAAVALLLAARPLRRRVGSALLVMVGVFGLATVVLGVTYSFVVAMVAMAVLNGADMVSMFIRGTIVPLATPEGMRGRVLAVEAVFIGASNELGAFESGVAGQVLGTSAAIVSGGLLTLLVVMIWWVWFPALRRIDRFEDLTDRSPGPL